MVGSWPFVSEERQELFAARCQKLRVRWARTAECCSCMHKSGAIVAAEAVIAMYVTAEAVTAEAVTATNCISSYSKGPCSLGASLTSSHEKLGKKCDLVLTKM